MQNIRTGPLGFLFAHPFLSLVCIALLIGAIGPALGMPGFWKPKPDPDKLPVYPNATLIRDYRPSDPGELGTYRIREFTTKDSPKAVRQYYVSAMTRAGWDMGQDIGADFPLVFTYIYRIDLGNVKPDITHIYTVVIHIGTNAEGFTEIELEQRAFRGM